MEFFKKLMRLCGVGKPNMDPIAFLPAEMVQSIFRYLDPRSLLNAAQVSRGWHRVCQSDPCLRATGRRHLRIKRRLVYDLPKEPRKAIKIIRKPPQKVSQPVVFTYGPAGVSVGPTKFERGGRPFKPLPSAMKKMLLRY
ncbi:uncharacterized protein LOC135165216 [Diachasmimorpha longicaudata]|uniref:uncharacterized protein LOC135165216 n=1 Tax=Diachasmimorpha longicaudata TaxID=58733 RepID=UPI0030B8EB83